MRQTAKESRGERFERGAMKVWLIQSVLSPYRIPLFQQIAAAPGVDFRLILLSDKFRTRPQWKREVHDLSFKVEVPRGLAYQSGPEHEYCINPFLLPKMLTNRPDVIVCGGYSFATLNAWLYRKLFRGRYVIWTEATMLTDGAIRGTRLWLRRVMGRGAAAFIDAGTLAREYVRHLVPDIPETKLFRAFNCVESPQFMRTPEEGRQFLAARGLPSQYLLFVGKLNERKGIPELLDVYRSLVAQRPDLGLVLLGDGPLAPQIAEFKDRHNLPRLHLPGFVRNEDTTLYYAGATAFMLLSRSDHNPLVLFEALAAGIPVICSQAAGNAVDFIEPGRNGFIVDPLDRSTTVDRTLELLGWDAARRADCRRFCSLHLAKANYGAAAEAFLAACLLAQSRAQ
jgi:glycosyltransferase involved in cell wall biosynthesis